MAKVSLLTLRGKVRSRADMEDSDFVSDTEMNSMINDSIGALVELVSNQDQNHYASDVEITASGIDLLTLPNDVHEVTGVDYLEDGKPLTLESFNFQERNRYNNPYHPFSTNPRHLYKYRPHGTDSIKITPQPPSGAEFRVWYTPDPPDLSADSDTFQFFNSWDEWVVLDVAIKCLAKEQSDATHLLMERQRVEERIRVAASRRNNAMPETMTNIYNLHGEDDY